MPGTHAISVILYQNSEWLTEETVRSADEALSAHESRDYTAAALKGGACLESILMTLLKSRGATPEPLATLGPLIGALRKTGVPEDLLERLNESNVIRNRAAHNRSSLLDSTTEGDSLQILNILALVVNWGSSQAQENKPQTPPAEPEPLPVFLSVGKPHRLDQEQLLQQLRVLMRSLNVELRTLSTYSDAPFDDVANLIRACRGALVVGLERSHAYTVFDRENSDRETLRQDEFIPTAWNQIEGSIASAFGLPVLILREQRLYREGIFEAKDHRHRIVDFDIAAEARGFSPELRELLSGWVQRLHSPPARAAR